MTGAELKCSLIISVYNQGRQLRQVLRTVAAQTERHFEILIADDGSSDDVPAILKAFQDEWPEFPVIHLWHPDRGFYKTIILNKVYREARSDYLVVIDGDMLLQPCFIEQHLRNRAPDRVLCGYRGVKLGGDLTADILNDRVHFSASPASILLLGLRGKLHKATRGLVLPWPWLRPLLAKPLDRLSGCNFSLYRERVFEVNGMDETILEYGYEDLEFGRRLQNAGMILVNVSRLCNTCHLDHPSSAKKDVRAIKQKIRATTSACCKHGLVELPDGSTIEDYLA